MNSRCLAMLVVGALVLGTAADAAAAGVFRRVWERRRAELHSQLSSELGGQVQQDVANASRKLEEANRAQIAAESKKVEDQLQSGLAKIQQETSAAVLSESQKLNAQLMAEMAKLRTAAQEQIAAETKKLAEQVQAEVANVQRSADAQVKDAVAKINARVADDVKKATELAMSETKNLVAAVNGEVDKLRGEVRAMSGSAQNAPRPAPAAPGKPQEAAAPSNPPQIKEEKQSE